MDKILRNIQVECLLVSYYSLQVPLAAMSDFLTSESRTAAVTYSIVEQVFVGRKKWVVNSWAHDLNPGPSTCLSPKAPRSYVVWAATQNKLHVALGCAKPQV